MTVDDVSTRLLPPDSLQDPAGLCDSVMTAVLTCPESSLSGLNGAWLADRLGVPHRVLKRMFRRFAGVSLDDFVCREWLNRTGQILMRENRLPLDQLAERLGYAHADEMHRDLLDHLQVDPLNRGRPET